MIRGIVVLFVVIHVSKIIGLSPPKPPPPGETPKKVPQVASCGDQENSETPYLFNKCNVSCQKPATCLPYTGEDAAGKNVKVCQCAKPFAYKDGVCSLQCGKDEFYDAAKYKCFPSCKGNEIQVNQSCKPLANLNENCESDRQCLPSFSECKSSVCSCRDGFSSDKSSCIPKQVSCPVGDVLKDGKGFKKCRTSSTLGDDDAAADPVVKRPPPRRRLGDDCPKGSFCLIISSTYAQENGTGYCCPAVNNKCPVGLPHPTAKCDASGPGVKYCPWDTHYCHSFSIGSTSNKQLCCPKVCASDAILIDDQCYPKIRTGGKCSKNEQCQDAYASCVDGVCQCGQGLKQGGSASFPYCIKECKEDEVLHDKKCEKRLKLSDYCKKEQEYLCPENGYCNKNNQCACRCGMFTLADNVCAPPPICRPPRPFPMFAKGGADMQAGAPPPPPVPRISDEEREKLLKNVTFCVVKDKTPPQGVKAAKCPSNFYCSPYLTNLGLCCKIPEAQCFGGGKPKTDKQCDAREPLSCGLDYSCLKYVYPVDQDENSKDNTICCPKSPFENP